MAQTKYKYKIGHYYSLTPREQDVVAQLAKIGIPERTFYRDRSILLSEHTDIPAGRLLKYAQFFGVDVEVLFSDEALKPKRSIRMKTGLKAAAFIVAAYLAGSCASYEGLGTCSTFKKTAIHSCR